eukprot:419537-Rhodomonas_salina.1
MRPAPTFAPSSYPTARACYQTHPSFSALPSPRSAACAVSCQRPFASAGITRLLSPAFLVLCITRPLSPASHSLLARAHSRSSCPDRILVPTRCTALRISGTNPLYHAPHISYSAFVPHNTRHGPSASSSDRRTPRSPRQQFVEAHTVFAEWGRIEEAQGQPPLSPPLSPYA